MQLADLLLLSEWTRVFSSSVGLSSVSGRADCPPTGRSNVGFLIRFVNASEGMAAWRDALRIQPMDEPVVEPVWRLIDRSAPSSQ